MSQLRVAVIDSGRGGRFMASELATLFPTLEFICETDEKNVPYGEKTPDELKILGEKLLQRGLRHRPKVIIVACHTLSSWCLEAMQHTSDIPVWSVNEALLQEIKALSPQSSLTLWGTNSTIQSNWFQTRIAQERPDLELQFRACPGLATAIENQDQEEISLLLTKFLQNESSRNLALACTHYPIVASQIRQSYSGAILEAQTQIKGYLLEFLGSSQE